MPLKAQEIGNMGENKNKYKTRKIVYISMKMYFR